jgi:hypothetical protein
MRFWSAWFSNKAFTHTNCFFDIFCGLEARDWNGVQVDMQGWKPVFHAWKCVEIPRRDDWWSWMVKHGKAIECPWSNGCNNSTHQTFQTFSNLRWREITLGSALLLWRLVVKAAMVSNNVPWLVHVRTKYGTRGRFVRGQAGLTPFQSASRCQVIPKTSA